MSRAGTVEGDERLRLFLALEVPADISTALAEWSAVHLTGGRRLQELHVTLAFLGCQARAVLPPVLDAMRSEARATEPFTLEPVRYRETRSVGMLVLADPSGRASRLAGRLHGRLEALGIYEPERRPWLPHVTVVRFRERPRLDPPPPETGPFVPSGLTAFLSRLHSSGAQYEALESCPLGAESLATTERQEG